MGLHQTTTPKIISANENYFFSSETFEHLFITLMHQKAYHLPWSGKRIVSVFEYEGGVNIDYKTPPSDDILQYRLVLANNTLVSDIILGHCVDIFSFL